MSNKILPVLLLLSVFSCSCSKYNCPIDTSKNIDKFKSYLKSIGNVERGKVKMLSEEYNKKIDFLSYVSGIPSTAQYGHMVGYNTYKEFRVDKRKYTHWLMENSCQLTDLYIDSALAKTR